MVLIDFNIAPLRRAFLLPSFSRLVGRIAQFLFFSIHLPWLLSPALATPGPTPILLDAAHEGRKFDGLGGVSAGASTRLLIDYPEPQRSQVLDYLFKPGFGASFHRLKVEIGGDMNSTDGTEPTHMRFRTDTNFHRGYEWWLMKEAVKRNPDIVLGCLPWGAPAWIGDGEYYSQDMADYVANFIEGAATIHGLQIQYTGIWNEKPFDAAWIKLLRRTLDARGLQRVKIAAADEWKNWKIVDALLADPELSAVVDYVSSHYPYFNSPAAAKTLPQPIWSGEDGTWSGDWDGSRFLAQMLSRNYVVGKMTATDIWSLVTSYYDALPLPDSGPMLAKTPWSGHFEVQPAIWVLAHTAQFTQPGWVYLDGSASSLLPRGGSIATLKSTNNSDFTVVVETFGASIQQTLTFEITNSLSDGPIAIWRTRQGDEFSKLDSIQPMRRTFNYTFDPECMYTLTTLTNGSKGHHTPPAASPFPLPYSDRFESYSIGALPKYWSDQAGSFEVVDRADQSGKSLRQVVTKSGIQWVDEFTPFTVIGERTWTDYEISADVLLETDGFVSLIARMENNLEITPEAYYVRLYANPGRWELWKEITNISSGSAEFTSGKWHQLRLQCYGTSIRAYLDGQFLAGMEDATFSAGLAAVASGWNTAQFDNIVITPIRGSINLAPLAQVSTSSVWIPEFGPAKIVDGSLENRWISVGTFSNQWVQFDFPQPTEINRVAIWDYGARITSAALEFWSNNAWSTVLTTPSLTNQGSFNFDSVTANRFRFFIHQANYGPGIHELQLFNDRVSRTIQLNEWMLGNTSTLLDAADSQFEPWIELWNSTTNKMDLSGYSFVLQGTQTRTSTVPVGFTLQPGEYLVVWADGESSQTDLAARSLHLGFILEEFSRLSLFSSSGAPIDTIRIDSTHAGLSQGGNPDASTTLATLPTPTPGRANAILLGDLSRDRQKNALSLVFRGSPFAPYQLRSRASLSSEWTDGPIARADGSGTVHFDAPATDAPSTFYQAVQR